MLFMCKMNRKNHLTLWENEKERHMFSPLDLIYTMIIICKF